MRESIIKELWLGNLAPSEKPYTADPEYRKLTDKRFKIRDKLCKTLTDEQLKLFEEYDDTLENCSSVLSTEAFSIGVSIGSKLILEILEQ